MHIEEENDFESELPEEEEEKDGGAIEDLHPFARLVFLLILAAIVGGFAWMVLQVAAQFGQ
jgi:hypothetical protein